MHIICIGKLKEAYLASAAAEYIKRIRGYTELNIHELPEERLPAKPSPAEITKALEAEGGRIYARLPRPPHHITALVSCGRQMSTQEFSCFVQRKFVESKTPVFIIGSSHGLAASIIQRADTSLSLSPMTFPHQIARILILEQLYRSLNIINGGKYHK